MHDYVSNRYQKYNPLATVPFATFKSLGEQPLIPIRDVECFHACLVEAMHKFHGAKAPLGVCECSSSSSPP